MSEFWLKESLRKALHETLPGHSAQVKMAPKPVGDYKPLRKSDVVSESAKVNSVMLLLTGNSLKNLELVMTLRSSLLPTHAGQLSLPGGRIEEGESEIDAALRETEEEIGISRNLPEVIGTLTPLFVPHSNNDIRSVVGFLEEKEPFVIQPSEVEEAFYIPVSKLMDPGATSYKTWTIRNKELVVPCWLVHKTPLWGATAMILSEFIEVIRLTQINPS
jgi:8-oxo-dGTP pyrophosphatase MutT (NUDIX family)